MKIMDSHANATTFDTALLQKVRHIGEEVVQPAAASVDHEARFPHEAIEALRQEQLLSAYVPQAYGGRACTITELAEIAQILAQYCASTAMIWAMHQIQVACIVNHEQPSSFFQHYLQEAVAEQRLLASITSEVGVGGDIRSSIAYVEKDDTGCRLEKKSTAISYGAYADGFLATARRSATAGSNDQVLVFLRNTDTQLTPTSQWNALGMRGTCSPGFTVSAHFPAEHILTTPFTDISAQTMVPFSHLLWSSCWLGIATSALARARKFLQAKARQMRATNVVGDTHLVEATALLQMMRANLHEVLGEYAQLLLLQDNREDALSNIGFTIKLNNVKIRSSQLVVQIVQQALQICGMAGYAEDGPFSVARHLRDAYSASLMISNDRLALTNSALLLVYKDH